MPAVRKPSLEEQEKERVKRERRRQYAQDMESFADQDPSDVLDEYAGLVEKIRFLNDQIDTLKSRKSIIEAWAITYAGNTGIDKISSRAGTLSISEAMRATYEPEKWNDILIGLVGVNFDAAVVAALKIHASTDLGNRDFVENTIRGCLTPGNLHVVQRRLTDTKVADLAIEGVPLPDGLGLEPYDRIHWTAAKKKVVANTASDGPEPLGTGDAEA